MPTAPSSLQTLPLLSVLENLPQTHPAFICSTEAGDLSSFTAPVWANAAYNAIEGAFSEKRQPSNGMGGMVREAGIGVGELEQGDSRLTVWLRALAGGGGEGVGDTLSLHLEFGTLHLGGQIAEASDGRSWIIVIGVLVPSERRMSLTRTTSSSNSLKESSISGRLSDVEPTSDEDPGSQDPLGLLSFSPTLSTSPCGLLLLETDWSTTPLGPISQWSQALRTAVSIMMSSTSQSCLLWGESRTILYNDAYTAVAGEKHPWLFGQPGYIGLVELWDNFEPHFTRVMQGVPFAMENDCLFIKDRNSDKPVETYCSWSYNPCAGAINGVVDGVINHQLDKTQEVLLTRRMKSLQTVGEDMARSTTTAQLFKDAAVSLGQNEKDFPFLLFYQGHVDEVTRKVSLSLGGSIGVPNDHPLAPKHVEIDESADPTETNIPGDVWPFHAALASGGPIYLHTLPAGVHDFERRGFGDVPLSAVAIPITAGPDAEPGVLIFGLNTRRPYDADYDLFIKILAQSMSAALGAAEALETQVQRSEGLRILDQVKTQFFENTSHELRTPLLLIAGPCNDALVDLRNPLVGPNRSRMKLIQRATARLLRLVNTLMSFSSVQSGRLNVSFRAVRLSGFVADLSSLFRSAVEAGGVTLNVHCRVDDPRVVWIDIPSFEKIVFNLLSNAFKYTKEGTIDVFLEFTDTTVLLTISDTGCGIAEKEQQLVLDRFHRVRAADGRSMEGTGIGLALCNSLVKLHGGLLDLTSTLATPDQPGGSSFVVTLPLGCDHLPLDSIDSGDSDPAIMADRSYGKDIIAEARGWMLAEDESVISDRSNNSSDSEGRRFPEARIMLVEDSPDAQGYICSLLAPLCKAVVVLKDGQAALDYLHDPSKERVDLILSDIMMPRLTGDLLLRFVRADPEVFIKALPVILMSARAGSEATSTSLASGATDYLAKPFTSRELIARVSTRLQQAAVKSELEDRITERTAELAESEARYRRITEASPVGVFKMGMDGSTITYANPMFFTLSGLDDSILPLPYSSLLETIKQGEEWEAVRTEQQAAICARESFTREWEWGDSSLGWALWEVKPVATGFLGTITNTTSAKLFSQVQLEASKAQVDHANEQRKSQSAFIDVVSHELRSPTNALVQAGDLLERSAGRLKTLFDELNNIVAQLSSEKQAQAAQLIREGQQEVQECRETSQSVTLCARHQSIIATDVLSVSRLEHGLDVTRVDFPLVATLNNIIEMFSVQAVKHGTKLSLDLGEGIDDAMSLNADPTRLGQILVNLVSNSCRILETWEGDRSVKISACINQKKPTLFPMYGKPPVEPSVDCGTVWFVASVRDSGPGISATMHAGLFTKFNESAAGNQDGRRGGGLGLYLAKKLVEMQDGAISVHSDGEGLGTTFKFFIKAKLAQSTPANPVTAHEMESPLSPALRPSALVLIVEDNLISQKLLRRQLVKAGFLTVVANNGKEGLNYLESATAENGPHMYPRAVTCDLEMPIMDGLQLTSRVRDMEEAKKLPGHLPFVCVTGNARQGQIDAALEAGMDHVMVKPYDISKLVALIDSLVTPNLHPPKSLAKQWPSATTTPVPPDYTDKLSNTALPP